MNFGISSNVTFPDSTPYEDYSCLFSFRSSVPKDKVYLYQLVSLDGSRCQMMENMGWRLFDV